MLQRPVVSYANGREIVITFGQEEAPVLELLRPAGAWPAPNHAYDERLRRVRPRCQDRYAGCDPVYAMVASTEGA